MDPAPDEGSAAAEAAQHLTNVLLPMDATPTLAAHVAPHAAFVSTITERADVVLASALFRELSQRSRSCLPAALLTPPLIVKARPGDVPASSRGRQRGVARRRRALCSCCCVFAARRPIAHASSTDQLLEVLDDAEPQSREDDAATFAASLYCVCLGLEWLGRTAYDERIANGVKRDGKILLGYDEDLTASESCVYDFAHVLERASRSRRPKFKRTTSSRT